MEHPVIPPVSGVSRMCQFWQVVGAELYPTEREERSVRCPPPYPIKSQLAGSNGRCFTLEHLLLCLLGDHHYVLPLLVYLLYERNRLRSICSIIANQWTDL